MKRITVTCMTIAAMCSLAVSASAQPRGGRAGGSVDKSGDVILQNLIRENVPKFEQFTYSEPENDHMIDYNLFIPEDYDGSQSYPLLLFIADASTAGKDVTVPLTQGYGALVWVTQEDQRKHPCFVLVPQYTTVTVGDNGSTSYEVDMTIRLVEEIVNRYNIDRSRIYTTGQSMGGMMSLYFNIAYPDLFAASLFVSCQWDTTNMGGFINDKFFYIVAAGDEKAPKGMAALGELLEKEGACVAKAGWSAKLPEEEQNLLVEQMLEQGCDRNFITFTLGSVQPPDGSGMEHMNSFDYAYKLSGVRDWLFRQAK
ncbi:MAG: prolyl oligopeptidase family serine peptidase [Alistipes sp.]|nr:prolyl oligopeptidase family serine peptidase [Alistipes sp.]